MNIYVDHKQLCFAIFSNYSNKMRVIQNVLLCLPRSAAIYHPQDKLQVLWGT